MTLPLGFIFSLLPNLRMTFWKTLLMLWLSGSGSVSSMRIQEVPYNAYLDPHHALIKKKSIQNYRDVNLTNNE